MNPTTTVIRHNGSFGLATTLFGRQVIALMVPTLKFVLSADRSGFEYTHVGPFALILGSCSQHIRSAADTR